MKEIKLKKLKLIYFKGFKNFEIDFNDRRTLISGRNKLGKSTIFDAWTWLLFGKDSLGNADFQIKTIENGKVIDKVDHEVEAVLEINGAVTTLKRVLREKWVKDELKGNETKCFIDGVPVLVTEYQKRINDIIDESTFKLITNLNYFHSLKMDDRRNILISLAGDISNESLVENRPELSDILLLVDNVSISDLKKRIAAEKKRINEELADIPIRIDEQKKNMPESVDFSKIENQIRDKKNELAEIEKALYDRQEKVKVEIERENEKRKQIGELRLKQQDILIEAELEATRVASEKNKDFYNFKSVVEEKRDKALKAERRALEKKNEIDEVTQKLEEAKKEREILAEQWKEENAKTFTKKEGCLICPLYNHECSDNEALFKFSQGVTDAEAEFNKLKREKLSKINESGLKAKAKIEELTSVLQKLNEELAALEYEYESIHNDYLAFAKLTPTECKPEPVVKEKIQEWVELEKQINAIKVDEVKQDNSDLIEERKRINAEILRLSVELNKKCEIEKKFKRIDELNNEQRILTQALAEQEKIEYQLLQFNKLKMEEVDRRVNGKFKYVKFKLFDTTLDGNEYEVCETLVDEIPYFSANNAGRVNAALDIINAVCEHNGVYAPIFIDNAESINEVISTKSQLILLIVTNDDLKIQ